MASQISGVSIVYSTFVRAQIKENIKAPRHWPLVVTVSNHRRLDCLLNRLFRRRWKKTLKLRSPVNYPHKRPVTLKMFPSDDVIMVDKMVVWLKFQWSLSYLQTQQITHCWPRVGYIWGFGRNLAVLARLIDLTYYVECWTCFYAWRD